MKRTMKLGLVGLLTLTLMTATTALAACPPEDVCDALDDLIGTIIIDGVVGFEWSTESAGEPPLGWSIWRHRGGEDPALLMTPAKAGSCAQGAEYSETVNGHESGDVYRVVAFFPGPNWSCYGEVTP